MTKIGIFGGSFDPIHYSHLRIIEQIQESIQLDEFRVIPCNLPNNSKKNKISSNEHRYNMLKLALQDKNVIIDTREFEREGVSYTIDTINSFNQEDELFLIMGDEINFFEEWKDYREIIKRTTLVCAYGREKPSRRTLLTYNPIICKMNPDLAISSSIIRDLVSKNKSIKYLTPDNVINYIKEKGLYYENSH